MYSAFIVDTHLCLADLQVTKLPAIFIVNPEKEYLSSRLLPQFTLQNISMFLSWLELYRSFLFYINISIYVLPATNVLYLVLCHTVIILLLQNSMSGLVYNAKYINEPITSLYGIVDVSLSSTCVSGFDNFIPCSTFTTLFYPIPT